MAINRGARASSHPTPSHFMATLFPPTPTSCSTQAHTSTRIVRSFFDRSSPVLSLFIRSSDRSWFVRPFVRSFVRSFVQIIFFPTVMLPKFWSFDHSIVHSPYSSFSQIIFVLPLCYRNSDRSFVRSFDRSFVRSFVHPNNLFPAVMLPKFRSFVRSIIRSFIVRS
jgi:hypothetical protein